MKTAAAIVTVGLVAQTNAFNLLKDVDVTRMDDWEFMEKSSYAVWNGFVRGLYRERANDIINKDCFGDWVMDDVKKIDAFADDLVESNIKAITYSRASDVAQTVVDLAFKHNQDCEFTKVINDMQKWCGVEEVSEHCTTEKIGDNLAKNSMQIFAELTKMSQLLFDDKLMDDEELIAWSDEFAEAYGSSLSYVLGFKPGHFHKRNHRFH